MAPYWIFLANAALLVAVLFSAIAAIWAAQTRLSVTGRLGLLMDFVLLLPLVLPSETLGFLLRIPLFPCVLFLGRFFHNGIGTYIGVPLGWAVEAFSPIYLCMLLGFLRVKGELLDAARMQGLGGWGKFWRVLLPSSWQWFLPGIGLGVLRISSGCVPEYLVTQNISMEPVLIDGMPLQLLIATMVLTMLLRLARRYA